MRIEYCDVKNAKKPDDLSGRRKVKSFKIIIDKNNNVVLKIKFKRNTVRRLLLGSEFIERYPSEKVVSEPIFCIRNDVENVITIKAGESDPQSFAIVLESEKDFCNKYVSQFIKNCRMWGLKFYKIGVHSDVNPVFSV